MTLLKDLLYGGRNEYLDIVRLLSLLGGLAFLVLETLEFAGLGKLDELTYAAAWSTILGTTVAAVYARNRSDRQQREHAAALASDAADRELAMAPAGEG